MRSWSIPLFSPFGIRLEVHFTFFLLVAFFVFVGWQSEGAVGVAWHLALLFLIFTCVVLHELGHSLAALHYKIPVDRILLLPIGGMAQFRQMPRDPWRELVITAAGPAVNFVLAAVLYLVLSDPWGFVRPGFTLQSTEGILQSILAINMVMGVFNLLPVFPMDGGRIFRALLAYRLPYLKATFIAATVAKILAAVGIYMALFEWNNFLLAILFTFIFISGELEYQSLRRFFPGASLSKSRQVGDLLRRSFPRVRPDTSIQQVLETICQSGPQDLVIMEEDGTFHGILPLSRLYEISHREDPQRLVGQYLTDRGPQLEASWPLASVYELLEQENQDLFPVFEEGQLQGVIDARELEESLRWLERRDRVLQSSYDESR